MFHVKHFWFPANTCNFRNSYPPISFFIEGKNSVVSSFSRIRNQNRVAPKAQTEPESRALNQPKALARTGTKVVETTPPRFPARFISPPAVPASPCETFIAVDQYGASVLNSRLTLKAIAASAIAMFSAPAPTNTSRAETVRQLVA